MAIKVIQAGLATSVQDLGRVGYYHLGIPLSGAMDQYALAAANLLVGNAPNTAALEMTFQGPKLAFETTTVLAVSGAHMTPRVNGVVMPLHESFAVKAGDVLSFDIVQAGARAYLAFSGGIEVPEVLGSRSTYGLGAIGGYHGRKLQANDVFALGSGRATVGRRLRAELQPAVDKEVRLRVLPGLYDYRVEPEALKEFFASTWRVTPEADRIGYRFKGGSPLRFKPRTPPFGAGSDPSNIVDAGYPFGSIQVPGGSEPIILHRDAVSGGGYAMVGTVISADMDLIAQLQPHHKAQFAVVTLAQALQARAERQARWAQLRHSF